jgi:hypothetical protein
MVIGKLRRLWMNIDIISRLHNLISLLKKAYYEVDDEDLETASHIELPLNSLYHSSNTDDLLYLFNITLY